MFITQWKPKLDPNTDLFFMEPVKDYMCSESENHINCTSAAAHIFADVLDMKSEAEEVFVTMCINASGRITGVFEACSGSVSDVHFAYRDIIRKALMLNAVSIIVAHNHPGGTPHPSGEDYNATKLIKEACDAIGLNFLDHFIIQGKTGEYYSFREENIHLW